MDLESECSVLESVDDNEEIKDDVVSGKLESIQINGSLLVENSDINDSTDQGAEVSGSVNSPPMDVKVGSSPSPTTTRKGFGLKKWRRIRRDANKGGDSVVDTVKSVTHDLSNSRGNPNPSKRMQVHPETKQKSLGSVSSTNAVLRSMDGFAVLDDSGLVVGPSFAAGTDSENSEDRSSKSSTAASAPKLKLEIPVVTGFPRDQGKVRSSSGKNLTHSVQRGHQGKGRIENTKKARGERVKIEKENSHSSMESDSRSSNFVFVQGIYSTSNGIRTHRPVDYDGENSDEVQGSARQVSEGLQVGYGRDGEAGYEENTPKDVIADSSWEIKGERIENNGSSSNEDPLAESIIALQYAQEALEKEVLKFKEISEGVSADSSSGLSSEFVDGKQKSKEQVCEKLPSKLQSSSIVQSEAVETRMEEAETELEELLLFKQKIEAEVEYMVISTTLQDLRAAAVDQITVLEEHKAIASEQTQMIDKLEDTKNKAEMLKTEAKKLETICEDIVTVDETLKLQTRVCKYTSCFVLQLVLFVVILAIFIVQPSPNSVDIVPT